MVVGRAGGERARALLLSHRIPYPPNKGDKIRSYRWIRALVRVAEVHVAAFVDDKKDLAFAPSLESLGVDVSLFYLPKVVRLKRSLDAVVSGLSITESVYRDARLERWLQRELRGPQYDCVIIFSAALGQYAELGRKVGRRLVVDYVDVDSEKWFQYAAHGGWLAELYRREGRLVRRLEQEAAAKADVCAFVTKEEAAVFREVYGGSSAIECVGNGVDLEFFRPRSPDTLQTMSSNKIIVFAGVMSYKANVDGVVWFCDHVFPIIRTQVTRSVFYIVGAKPVREVRRLACRDVVVTGTVDDVRPFLAMADAVVAPLRVGRGIQNKVLEGMSMAKPMVVTTAAASGIGAIHKRDLLIGDDPVEFGRLVCDVLRGKWPNLGFAARAFIERNHRSEEIQDYLVRLALSFERDNAEDAHLS